MQPVVTKKFSHSISCVHFTQTSLLLV